MDPDTRIGAPAAYPQNPDSFEHFNAHANRLLDFHRFDCHHGTFKFPVAKSNWSVVTRVSHERDEESDDKHSAAVAAAQAVGNPLPPSPPQKLHFTWGVEYVYDPKTGALQPQQRLRALRGLRNGPRPRVLRGDQGTVAKASVENDGTLDAVLEHRVSRNFMFKTYGLYYDAPNSSLLGMNFRFDGSIWNADLKVNTDGGVGGLSAAVQPLPGTVVGCEAFYIRAEKGPIYALGVKQQLKLARWLRPSTFTFTATSLGALVGAYSAPVLSDRLKVATRFGYDLATYDSTFGFGAEFYPVRTLLGLTGKPTTAAAAPVAAAPAAGAAAAAVSAADAKTTAAADATSPLRDLKLQAMIDPHARYAVSVSLPVTDSFHAGASVSKRWTQTAADAPTFALSATYE